MQSFHLCPFPSTLLSYSRNFKSNWLPCPSKSRNAGMLSGQLNTSCWSIVINIWVNNSAVILLLSEQQQNIGIVFSIMNSHSGPSGCILPLPIFCSIWLSLSWEPAHGEKGSSTRTYVGSNSLVATITAHITGSPDAVVNPNKVKCVSLHAALICGLSSSGTKYFSPPQLPSFACEVLLPTSSTKSNINNITMSYVTSPADRVKMKLLNIQKVMVY